MKKWTAIVLTVFSSLVVFSQDEDVQTITNINEALENPEAVVRLDLSDQSLNLSSVNWERFEPLVSCKVANREVRTEGSRTTKLGTDEQEPYMRHNYLGKQAHHCNAQKNTKKVVM
jgi:hypothetical protein